MEYLIFKTLAAAITISILIYYNMKRKDKNLKQNLANPKELENGNFAIEKPDDKFLTGVEATIETNVIFKQDAEAARPPDPKGTPTIRPV